MDPFSIAASIAGLVGLTAQVLKATKAFAHEAKHGREFALELLNELNMLHFNLSRLDEFLRSASGGLHFQDTSVLVSSSFSYREKLRRLQERLDVSSKSRLVHFKWPLSSTEHHQSIGELRAYAQCVQLSLDINGCALLSKTSDEVIDVLRSQLEAFQLLETISHRTLSSQRSSIEHSQMLKDHHAADEREKMLDWISVDPHEQKHHKIRLPRVVGTGDWFLELDEFRRWRDSADVFYNALLCQGIQGSGKSVLASLVIDYLKDSFVQQENVVAYVYCDYEEHEDQSAEKMVASLLKQIASADHGIPEPLKRLHQKFKAQGRTPQQRDLEQTLSSTCDNYARVYIVIDALDECNPRYRKALVEFLAYIQHKDCVKILMTSRSYPESVMKYFKAACRISIGAHEADLKKYILQEIDRSDNVDLIDENFKSEIIDKVSAGAQNMFLLAVLQAHAVLDGVSACEMEEALETMPRALDDAFEATLKRIQDQPENRRALGMKALMWISYAQRPLLIGELVDILALKSSERSLNQRHRPSPRLLLECCFGLVSLDEKSSVVRLVHYSVQEYLLVHRSRVFPSGEEIVAEKCLRYMLFDAFNTGSCVSREAIINCLADYPFYGYNCRYWGCHVRIAGGEMIENLAMHFLQSRPHVARSYQLSQWVLGRKKVYWQPEEGNSCTGLHLACAFGLDRIAKELLDTTFIEIDLPTEMGTTPLIKSAAGGHEECVRMLLDRGADVTKENWYGPALHCAAEAGAVTSINMLLSKNVDVNKRDHDGRTALFCATLSGHPNAIETLLSNGADVNAGGHIGETPLGLAINWQLSKEIVRMLLINGADTEVLLAHCGNTTVLHEACFVGSEGLARLLLEYKSNVDATDDKGRTPLHYAVQTNSASLLHVLLEYGAKIDATDNQRETPLHYASELGCKDSVTKLLEWGADTEATNHRGFTALQLAYVGNGTVLSFV